VRRTQIAANAVAQFVVCDKEKFRSRRRRIFIKTFDENPLRSGGATAFLPSKDTRADVVGSGRLLQEKASLGPHLQLTARTCGHD
jgi:hypothetical protein